MNKILTFCILTSVIKLILFILNFDTNSSVIYRAGELNLITHAVTLVFFILAGAIIYFAQKEFTKKSPSTQKKLLFVISIIWFFQCLFTNKPAFNRNYLSLYLKNLLNFSELSNLLNLDFFYETPHIFFWIIYLVAALVILNNFKIQKYAFTAFIVPFFDVGYQLDDFTITTVIGAMATALYAFISKSKISPLKIFELIIGIQLINAFAYHKKYTFTDDLFPIITLFILLFISYFFLRKTCKTEEKNKFNWIFIAFLPLFMSHCFIGLRCSHLIIASWAYETMNFGFILILALLITSLSFYIGKISKTLENSLFAFGLIITNLIYIIDGLMLFSSKMTLDINTLNWLLSMKNKNTVLKTAATYFTLPMASAICFGLIVSLLLAAYIKKIKIQKDKYGLVFAIFIYSCSELFIIGLRPIPNLVKDPIYSLFRQILTVKKEIKLLNDPAKAFQPYGIKIIRGEAVSQTAKPKYNLIHITLESVHSKYLDLFSDEKTWPKLSKFADRMDFFSNIYSSFPETGNGNFSIISGLYSPSYQYLPRISMFTAPTLASDLKASGYNCCFYTSASIADSSKNVLANPFDFQTIKDSSSIPESKQETWQWGVKEEYAINSILKEIKQDTSKPKFIWYITVYPHQPITVFESSGHKNNIPKSNVNDQTFEYTEALRYLDKHLSRMINEIDEMKLPYPTIISMTADHGEMLGEKEFGGIKGHGISIHPTLTNIPLLVIKPKEENNGLRINNRLGSQADIVPTLLDFLHENLSRNHCIQGQSLISDKYEERPVYLSSMFGAFGLIENGLYYEFFNPSDNSANVYKIKEGRNHKMNYPLLNINVFKQEYLKSKLKQIKEFYELQDRFLHGLQRMD